MATRKQQPEAVEPEAVEPEAVEVPVDEAPEAKSEAVLRREAYTAAVGRLKEEQRDRFRALVLEEAAARGVTYEFRKTDEEKAAEQMKALLAQFPDLAKTLPQQG